MSGIRIFLTIFCAAMLFPVSARADQPDVLAITGGRVITGSATGVIEGGTVIVRKGRIEAVGRDIAIPAGARIVDAKGGFVTAGLISPWSQLGLVEVETVGETLDMTAGNSSFSAGFEVAPGVNPASTIIPTARLAGVTRAVIFPVAGTSIFAGTAAIIGTDGADDSVFDARSAIFIELGARGAELSGGARGATWVALRRLFSAALAGGKKPDPDDIDGAAIRALVAGDLPMVAHVERAADIRQLIAFARAYPKLRVILFGASEGWVVASEIAAARMAAIVDSYANLPVAFETMGATQQNARRLANAGVTIAIAPLNRFSAAQPHDARLVAQYAGNAVANGLNWAQAFDAVTINPARMFGIDRSLGSLEPGKIADVLVWNADPLEIGSAPVMVLIAGREMPLKSRQTELFERYRNLGNPKPFQFRN
ncbi:amidohydrolase family protein [Sphingosinicella sp.]|uniref:amidohydrolase family protein n=1 Tax=Sphingosinicella sp. TaxID=1917971 RepID=UPI0035B44F85